ncbi:phycobilisome rod-core linker polypeptide [Leptothoe sp. PORK10 BA2]|uniref:phycobilisome rod-core linker polypeptide n=1 Tax=Leptothoe sp. PORK10 BA2 TaxID=3110254 RepID=UPI002B201F6D|nr:phycobilisome rod-core linker polypeptide [Leptothoe sp. PORK10 BA2]
MNSSIRLGTQAFDEADPVQLWPSDSLEAVEIVIRAVYRQVLGNAHVMESERAAVADAESQLQNHAITVREFIRQIAKSELYRTRFFEPCSRNRFIELNFKHLLGRAPDSYSDIAVHGNLIEADGFEAEIDSYLDSDEYHQVFGEDTVPFYRGHKSPTGQKVSGFANLLKLLRGAASHDNSLTHDQQARLNQAIMANHIGAIAPVTRPATEWKTPITAEAYALMFPSRQPAAPEPKPAIQLGTQAFDETAPVELWANGSSAAVDVVIRAVYRQVLGNAHVMESERLTVADAESQLRHRYITVREFIRKIAKSELYRSRFFEPCSRSRLIELNFKHLLGRAPNSYNDIADHSHILDVAGFDAEIDAYLDSSEYLLAFGDNIVPYYRGHQSPTGQKVVGFANLLQLLRGAASNDNNPVYKSQARLTQALMANHIGAIAPLSSPADITYVPTFLQKEPELTPAQLASQQTYQGYASFQQTPPVELVSGASADDIEGVIRAVYRQVMGNAHIMESERLVVPESQLKHGELTVREFVRQVAKSELYRSRFAENCYRYRAMELNFKHLLGRAPQNFAEMKAHSTILDTAGYEADIDSYIDSDEYQNAFGENLVPFYRGYQTAPGQTMVEFTNMLQLLKSASSSDKDLTDNRPRIANAILPYQPEKVSQPRDAQEILAEVFKFIPATTTPATAVAPAAQPNEQDVLIAKLQQQLAELRPAAGIGESFLRKGTQPKAVLADPGSSPQQADEKAAVIERLQGELMAARSLAAIGESRLNKWQQRNFR